MYRWEEEVWKNVPLSVMLSGIVSILLKKSRFLPNLLLAVKGSDEFQGLSHVLGRCKTVVRDIMYIAFVASVAVPLGIFC